MTRTTTRTQRSAHREAQIKSKTEGKRLLSDAVMRPLMAAHMAYTSKVTARLGGRCRKGWVKGGGVGEWVGVVGGRLQ